MNHAQRGGVAYSAIDALYIARSQLVLTDEVQCSVDRRQSTGAARIRFDVQTWMQNFEWFSDIRHDQIWSIMIRSTEHFTKSKLSFEYISVRRQAFMDK